jgi:hypothetical protein
MNQYFGKYRGKVENNVDPMMQGRVQVSVPAVLGDGQLNWAMPCAPMAGPQMGIFAVPPKGANVWVEFEGGDPNMPIWSGGFWGVGEFPTQPPVAPGMSIAFIKTKSCSLELNDLPGVGGVTLKFLPAYKISMTATSLEITNGTGAVITLGPATKVTVNNGALEILF